jgi:hypothetical protein
MMITEVADVQVWMREDGCGESPWTSVVEVEVEDAGGPDGGKRQGGRAME